MNTQSDFFIRQLHEEDRFVVSDLRRSMISHGFSFVSDKTLLNWGPSDRKAFVYGLFFKSTLVSTLRLEIVTQIEIYETRLELSNDIFPATFPVLITSRAATQSDFQKRGAYSVLKLACIAKAMSMDCEYCFATVKSDSFQVDSFRKIGYEFFTLSSGWKGFLQDSSPPLVGRLNLKTTGISSIDYLCGKQELLLRNIRWSEGYLGEIRSDIRERLSLFVEFQS